jgi:hypothetical protein
MRLVSLIAVLVGVSACRIFESEPVLFPNARTYAHDLFPSPEECSEAQKLYFINCSQVLILCPTGDAQFVVTDIAHRANYAVVGRRLTLRVPVNLEIQNEHVFEISEDERTLRLLVNNTLWVRREEWENEAERYCSGWRSSVTRLQTPS